MEWGGQLSWKPRRCLAELLMTNGGCELPCWWGITPGATSLQDAREIFLALGKPVGTLKFSTGELEYEVAPLGQHLPDPFDYVVRQSFTVKEDVVSRIAVSVEPPVWKARSERLAEEWKRYALDAVLVRFGPPDRVSVFSHHPSCGDTYWLDLVYGDLGVCVAYSGAVTLCPGSEEPARMRMGLATPGTDPDSWGFACGSWSPSFMSEVEANSFYESFVAPGSPACLELPEQTEYTCP